MVQVLGGLVVAFGVLLVIGGLTGRVKLRNCCSIADPRNDLRMRDAFLDETGATAKSAPKEVVQPPDYSPVTGTSTPTPSPADDISRSPSERTTT